MCIAMPPPAIAFIFHLDCFALVLIAEAWTAQHRVQSLKWSTELVSIVIVQSDCEEQYAQVDYLITIQSIQSDSSLSSDTWKKFT